MKPREKIFAERVIRYVEKNLGKKEPSAMAEYVAMLWRSRVSRSGIGKRAKSRGKRGEREVVAFLKSFGIEAKRGQQHSGGQDSPDVVTDLADWHFEVKDCQALSVYSAMSQAIRDAGGLKPVVVHRRDNRPWLAILDFETFLSLVKGDAPCPSGGGE